MTIEHKTAPAFQIVKDFEAAIGEYTGAPSVVCVNSCTMALKLSLEWMAEARHELWLDDGAVSIPKRTYVSVPMQILDSGWGLEFRDQDWRGRYQLEPLPIWDCARWFTRGMFPAIAGDEGIFVCVSFHSTKTLGLKRFPEDGLDYDIEQGGAILHNAGPEAGRWLRSARFDGRTEGAPISNESVRQIGFHCYMNPSSARLGLETLKRLPSHNPPLPNDDYPDLSTFEVFQR